MDKEHSGFVPSGQRTCTKHSTGFRIMGRHRYTSKVWNAGTFTSRYDAYRHIKVVLETQVGNWIIYRVEAF